MVLRFAAGARVAVTAAHDEARLRGDRRIGSEHLLLGVLHAHSSLAAAALGVDLARAREALRDLDRAALAAIGVDIAGIAARPIPASHKRTPMTSGARAVLARAVTLASQTPNRRITTEHLLAALLDAKPPDPAADLLDHLGVDRQGVRSRLAG